METEESSQDVQLQSLKQSELVLGKKPRGGPAVIMNTVSLGWKSDSGPILESLDFEVQGGQLVMLVGPVASGKSTLLQGLLGELPHVTGTIELSSHRVSWCGQSPWLINETIRKNIICFSEFDAHLYRQVLTACDLEKDLAQLPEGDQTVIGSKGLALSGGQKQRVRVFSAERGILRAWGTSIVLATQSGIAPNHEQEGGKIAEMGSFEDCQNTEGYVSSLITSGSHDKDKGGGIFHGETTADETTCLVPAEKKTKAMPEGENKRRQLGDWSVYGYYFGTVGVLLVAIMLFLQMTWAFFSTFPTVWLNFWTDANAEAPGQRDAYYLGVYAAFQVGGVFSFGVLMWFVLVPIAARSGINLHQNLLKAVMHAPLSLFTSTDIGSLTTRFSQDKGLIDRSLPLALVISLASFFTCIGKAFLIASASCTHFIETLSGLPTLRAHSLTNPSIAHSYTLIDRSQRPFYILLLTQQWLTLVLDLTTTALAILVVGLAVRLRATVSVGLTGFWTSLETSIGAVARIKNFSEETTDEVEDDALRRSALMTTTPEGRGPVAETDVNGWPGSGAIELRDVSASYDVAGQSDGEQAAATKALDGVSLSIRPGEKIGIQFVLSGTVRQNLDPVGVVAGDDAVIESTLAHLGLWETIRENGGLDAEFYEEALSHGQRQLFFLARAILRKDVGRVVLLDEATSSVDIHTEKTVEDLIREEFKDHSVLAIAHRLDTVADFDRVVVLDKGRVVEVGSPRDLLRQAGGRFRELWDASKQGGRRDA
ncbi:ABC multidrug transporter [Colletotrichum graminicola]|nr:ABC multidrug transporter [Colletotrichum graminicola]